MEYDLDEAVYEYFDSLEECDILPSWDAEPYYMYFNSGELRNWLLNDGRNPDDYKHLLNEAHKTEFALIKKVTEIMEFEGYVRDTRDTNNPYTEYNAVIYDKMKRISLKLFTEWMYYRGQARRALKG